MWRIFDVNSEMNCSCLNRLPEYSLWLDLRAKTKRNGPFQSQNRVLLENTENVLSLEI